MSANEKVLLDTDIGNDIDDALALAYLLKQPRCELLGITTVTGEPEKRAALADAICQAAGRGDVPIHVGAATPFLVEQRQERAGQLKYVTGRFPHRDFAPRNTAIEFLRDTIRAYPHEVTLLTIGPLSNIALLFALDPGIPALLKQIVIMGGRFNTKSPEGFLVEWNILLDPHAAAKVFQAPIQRLSAVGLDVTDQCRIASQDAKGRFESVGGVLAPVAAIAEGWAQHATDVIFHDPLAAALIFEPQLCRFEARHVEIDLESRRARGQTIYVHDSETTPHHVAMEVDAAAFFDHYFSVVSS
jgi:purine nucleosidase